MKIYNEFEDGDWQVVVDDDVDSSWYNKSESINRIVEMISDDGENKIVEFEFEGCKLSLEDLKFELENLPEDDFYTVLEDLKGEADYIYDIKMVNISDDSDVDFLEDSDNYDDFINFD